MSPCKQLIQVISSSFQSQEDLDQAYLSDASDQIDLERRMREMDRRSRETRPGRAFVLNAQ